MVVLFVLSAVMLAEAAVILGCVIWREGRGARGRAKTGESGRPVSGPSSGDEKSLEMEKRQQEGIDAIMGYDLAAARKAVRRDGEEE